MDDEEAEAGFCEALAAFGLQPDDADEADAGQPAPEVCDEGEVCEVWPWHVDALNLFLACLGQLQLSMGMGGAHWRAAPSPAVAQEVRWLGILWRDQYPVVRQYREIEAEALRILNERELQAVREISSKL